MTDSDKLPDELKPYLKELEQREVKRASTSAQANAQFLDQGNVLYHYTNAQGLQGILQHRKLWFTDYRHLNDPSELHFGVDIISDVVNQIPVGANSNAKYFLGAVASMLAGRAYSKQLEFFIASFSTDGDQLGQWRAYADDGRGFAIGFAPRLFRTSGAGSLPEHFSPVTYGSGLCTEKHREPLEDALEVFVEAMGAHANLLNDKDTREAFINAIGRSLLASSLIWNCLTSKHAAYKHEKEVRLILLGTRQKLEQHVKTRIRGSEIVPYIPVEKSMVESDAIVEIVTGPAASPDSERTVRTMLREYGYPADNILVSPSEIPYRPPS